jgi:hypothetical protein
MKYMKQQTQSKTPDPDAEFLHSLLPDIKSITAKQKRMFKTGWEKEQRKLGNVDPHLNVTDDRN